MFSTLTKNFGGGASLLVAAVASTGLTAAAALPLAVSAATASSQHQVEIALDESRFPAPVDLGTSELALGVGASSQTAPPLVGPTPQSDARPREADSPKTAELAIALPTPTPTAVSEPSTPPPVPTPTVAPTPTLPAAPEPTPTKPPAPDPTPSASPTATATATPQPTDPPLEEPLPTATPQVIEVTDVYAYVAADAALTADEPAELYVKAVNGGANTTTDVTMHVTVQGGTVVNVTPDPYGWSCAGGGTTWVCTGGELAASDMGRQVVGIIPGDGDVQVAVSITHGLGDPIPANNALNTVLAVANTAGGGQ